MFTDLSGFSRRVAEFGIIHFLQIIHESSGCSSRSSKRTTASCSRSRATASSSSSATAQGGRVRDRDAARLRAAQRAARARGAILLCVGLGFGRVLRIGDHDVFGAEVNAASKLGEDIARPWEILVTGSVKQAVEAAGCYAVSPIEEIPPGARAAYRVEYG